MIYFTSDLHLNYGNIIKYNIRPFINSIEMDRRLIENINKMVTVRDELYVIGDFAFARKVQTNEYLDKIRG